MGDYTEKDIARMKYYYKEMKTLRDIYPKSLPLINGMAHIEKVCGLEQVTQSVDFSEKLNQAIALAKVKLEDDINTQKTALNIEQVRNMKLKDL